MPTRRAVPLWALLISGVLSAGCLAAPGPGPDDAGDDADAEGTTPSGDTSIPLFPDLPKSPGQGSTGGPPPPTTPSGTSPPGTSPSAPPAVTSPPPPGGGTGGATDPADDPPPGSDGGLLDDLVDDPTEILDETLGETLNGIENPLGGTLGSLDEAPATHGDDGPEGNNDPLLTCTTTTLLGKTVTVCV